MKKPFYKKWWVWAIAAFIILGLALSPSEEERAQMEAEEQQAVKEVTAEPEPQTLEEQIKSEINKALGETTNNDDERIVDLTFNEDSGFVRIVLAGDDNLTNNLTKVGLLSDAADAFPILFKDNAVKDAMISIQLPLVDQYGNSEDGEVMAMELDRKTHEKINYENFNPENFETVAKNYFEHPALNK